MSDTPRRICVDKHTPAERAITHAIAAVESMAADVRLTDAVVLLSRARERVADFVDGVPEGPQPRHVNSLGTSHPWGCCPECSTRSYIVERRV